MSRHTFLSAALLLPLLPCAVAGAQGELDPAFGTAGKVVTDTGDSYRTRASLIQPDGKILVTGLLTSGGAQQSFANRYLPDGSLDAGFGSGGISAIDPAGPDWFGVEAAALQADGKIVLAGSLDVIFTRRFAALRLNSDGTIDTSFGTAGLVVTELQAGSLLEIAFAVAIQPDGKILAAGVRDDGSRRTFAVVRYLSDGSLDPSFGGDGKVLTDTGGTTGGVCYHVAVLPDGGIVAGGYDTSASLAVVKYESDGTLSPSFGAGGMAFASIGLVQDTSMAIHDDGRILLGGFVFAGPGSYDSSIARFLADGTLDPSFDGDGLAPVDLGAGNALEAIALQPDGKIIAVGGFTEKVVARVDTNGAQDPTFGSSGTASVAFGPGFTEPGNVAIQPDGKLVVATSYYDGEGAPQDCALARLVGQVWEDAGAGLAGATGTPNLSGSGSLLPNTAFSLSLDDAAATSPAFLVFGASRLDFPLFGGTLVPSPDVVMASTTDAGGDATTSATWPTGVSTGTPYYSQYWILDATGPFGLTASNALIGVAQ